MSAPRASGDAAGPCAAARASEDAADPRGARRGEACPQCLRRTWLLGELSKRLEFRGRALARLTTLLELSDEELMRALCTSEHERELLAARHGRFDPASTPATDGVRRICRHDPRYPRSLARTPSAPHTLHVTGGLERMERMLAEPAVAIVGARAASDYGIEIAHGLARGLAAAGVTVLGGFADGIAAAAHAGALAARGPTLTVAAGGVDVCHPAIQRALQRALSRDGCALAELPCGQRPGGWCHTARRRIVVGLARLVIVVESGEQGGGVRHAELARELGVPVAAVPGRVTSPLAAGPHALLRAGALLVRDAGDVLDALYGVDENDQDYGRRALDARVGGAEESERAAAPDTDTGAARGRATGERRAPSVPRTATLEPRLRAVLELVAGGRDTLDALAVEGTTMRDTLVALAKLELCGALVRGDGGRYLVAL